MNEVAENFGFKLLPEERTCENCACSYIAKVGTETQMFCRLRTPQAKLTRVEVPRLDKEGKPVMDRNGKPAMNQGEQLAYLYPPTMKTLTCFDGWRPTGTLPGDKWTNNVIDEYMKGALVAMERLARDVEKQSAESLAGLTN